MEANRKKYLKEVRQNIAICSICNYSWVLLGYYILRANMKALKVGFPAWNFQMGSTMKRSIFDQQTSKALKNWHQKAVKKTNEGKPGQLQTRNWVEIRMPLQCIPHPSHLLDLRNLVLKIQISLMLKQTKWQLWISMQITNVAQLTVASNLVTGIYQVKHSYGSC